MVASLGQTDQTPPYAMSSLAVSQTHTVSSRMNPQRNWGRCAVTLCKKSALGSIRSAPRVSLRLTSHCRRLAAAAASAAVGSALPSSCSSGNSNDRSSNHGNEFIEISSKFQCINYRYTRDKAHEILEAKVGRGNENMLKRILSEIQS